MTRHEIIKTLNRAGFQTELNPVGLVINGKLIRHNDSTGVTSYNSTKFRSRDIWEFLNFLMEAGFDVHHSQVQAARKAEKIS